MEQSAIWRLPEQEALDEIVETVLRADRGEAPFALVLGSGFSRGLVPTARELVSESLPLWLKCRDEAKEFEDYLQDAAESAEIARSFWKRFSERNTAGGLNLKIDSVTGLPEDNGEAYRAAFSPRYRGAVGAPADARRFQRAMMRLNKPRLNAAHFLLASLLGVQPGKTRESGLFRSRAAFSRLILTTNFDPFLQTALQAVNLLYFMSDTPELGLGDEIFDDQTDAIHLVYLHGSIHRRSQAATDQDIQRLKEKNARTLAPVLKRRGVIVLGYSGWDDAIVAALAECEEFDYRLYWCGLEADPLTKGAFGPGVEDILHKASAFYVQSAGAGNFMGQLCRGLVKGNPRLLDNPIGQLKDLLDSIDLKELEELKPLVSDPDTPQPVQSTSVATTLVEAKRLTIERLTQAEQIFLGRVSDQTAAAISERPSSPARDGEKPAAKAGATLESKSNIQQAISSAQLALTLGLYEGALKQAEEALKFTHLEVDEKAELLASRAQANYWLGRTQTAIDNWREVIDLPGASIEQVSGALINRAFVLVKQKDFEKAIADYTQVIEHLPDVPIGQIAKALNNRGVTFRQKGEPEKAIADYTRVIEQLPLAPVDQVAYALNNRGFTLGTKGDVEKELADYTRLIEDLPGAPVEQIAYALYNRAVTWGKKGEAEKELADYTRLIEQLPKAPVDNVARALNNRGIAWGKKGDVDRELADYTRVIEQLQGAPVEQVAIALNNRGVVWGTKGDLEKGLADYTRVIEQLQGAPVEQVARALNNRGIAGAKKGDMEKAIADYTRVIEQLPLAPVDQVAYALNNRGFTLGTKGDVEKELADYTRLIEDLPGAPVEQVAYALYNRAVTWGKKGEAEKELADYTRLIEQLPKAPVDNVAIALNNRGIAWGKKGDVDRELADHTRVIEQLQGAPVEQVAIALNNRGVGWGKKGDLEKELADYTRVIEQLQGVPVEQVAIALNNRGGGWGKKGDLEKGLGDYTRVIEQLQGAPLDQVTAALTNRGWLRYQMNDFAAFLSDTEAALAKQARDGTAFNRGLALLASGRDSESLIAYRSAAETFAPSIDAALIDLNQARKSWLTPERAKPVIQLLESLQK